MIGKKLRVKEEFHVSKMNVSYDEMHDLLLKPGSELTVIGQDGWGWIVKRGRTGSVEWTLFEMDLDRVEVITN